MNMKCHWVNVSVRKIRQEHMATHLHELIHLYSALDIAIGKLHLQHAHRWYSEEWSCWLEQFNFTSYSYIAHSFILVSEYLVLHFSACVYNMVSHFSCSSMNTCILSPLDPTFTFTLKHRSLQFFWYICYDWFGSSFEQKFLCNDCIDMVFCVCASVLFTILFHGLAFCYIFRQDGEWLLKLKDFSIKDMVPNDQHRNILELGETIIFRIELFWENRRARMHTHVYMHACTHMLTRHLPDHKKISKHSSEEPLT